MPCCHESLENFQDVRKLGFHRQLGQQSGGDPVADDDLETAVGETQAAVTP
jgi:hypothetical protein